MKRVLQSLIVWLMLLALPLQGLASVGMLSCSHDAAPAAATPVHANHAVAQDEHAHHAAAVQAADAHDHVFHPGHGKCSSCASCGVGAAMAPAAGPTLAHYGAPTASIDFIAGHVPSVDLALPERPPRFLRA